MKYKEFLYDEIGNEYERKSLFILELARLHEKLETSTNKNEVKAEIKKLIENKNKHEYNLKLKEYKNKDNLVNLNNKKNTHYQF